MKRKKSISRIRVEMGTRENGEYVDRNDGEKKRNIEK